MDSISPDVQNYISILEKTNQQLSLWYNPYGIAIAALAILFAVLAVAVTVVIYRQSRDYKEKLEADREFYKNKMAEFLDTQAKIIEERSKTAKELSKKIDESLKEYKKKLEKSSKNQKEEIQKVIDKLELEKLTLKTDVGPLTVSPNFDYSSLITADMFGKKMHKCSHCDFGFYVNTNPTYSIALGGNTVTCPKCGNIDSIY